MLAAYKSASSLMPAAYLCAVSLQGLKDGSDFCWQAASQSLAASPASGAALHGALEKRNRARVEGQGGYFRLLSRC